MRTTAIVGFLSVLMNLMIVQGVFATSFWPWSEGVDIQSTPIQFDVDRQCPTYRSVVQLTPLADAQQACVFADGDFMAVNMFVNGVSPVFVFGSRFMNAWIPLLDTCRSFSGCRYNPKSDILTSVSFSSSGRKQLEIHTSLRENLAFTPTGYTIKQNAPKVIQEVEGYSIGSYGISNNGRWIAFEIEGKGFGIYDVLSDSSRQLTDMSASYGRGFDPFYEIAVSDDGSSVAAMGENAGFIVYHNDFECGKTLSAVSFLQPLNEVRYCAQAPLSTTQFSGSFRFAAGPRFDKDGTVLRFNVSQRVLPNIRVALAAHGSNGLGTELMAVGDSFTSGEGELDQNSYLAASDTALNKCHISNRSYPFVIGDSRGIKEQTVNVACSGATITDIIANTPLSQRTLVRDHGPKELLLGAGGNDAGLLSKLKTCLMPDICEWVESQSALQAVADEIRRVRYVLERALTVFIKENPGIVVRVIGYPSIVSEEGECHGALRYLLHPKERIFIKESTRLLNDTLRQAASNKGVVYEDIENAFLGHRLCEGDEAAMNGLRAGDDVAPIGSFPLLKIFGNESFHPTPFGHRRVAEILLDNPLHSVAEPTDYWGDGGEFEGTRLYNSMFLTSDELLVGQEYTIKISSWTFAPGTQVQVSIRSSAKDVGVTSAGELGELEYEFTLPEIEEGFHTIHLKGLGIDGRVQDIYQVVSVRSQAKSVQSNSSIPLSYSSSPAHISSAVLVVIADMTSPAVKGVNVTHKYVSQTFPLRGEYMVIGSIVVMAIGIFFLIRKRKKRPKRYG